METELLLIKIEDVAIWVFRVETIVALEMGIVDGYGASKRGVDVSDDDGDDEGRLCGGTDVILAVDEILFSAIWLVIRNNLGNRNNIAYENLEEYYPVISAHL